VLCNGAVGLLATTSALLAPPVASAAGTPPPAALAFVNSTTAVSRGSTVGLHWPNPVRVAPPPGQYFLVTSVAPDALPNFGSRSEVAWPPSARASWQSAKRRWTTTADAMTVAIPPGSKPGTTYRVQVYTCTTVTDECSNSPGATGPIDAQESLTVTTGWTMRPYTRDFAATARFPEHSGQPVAVTFSSPDTIWNTSEFSNTVTRIEASSPSAKAFGDPANVERRPFAYCFTATCTSSVDSALSERVVSADGRIWFTQGGWFNNNVSPYPVPNNHSEIVAFDPSTKTLCTYVVPGNDNEVMGLASIGSPPNRLIWFTESRGNGLQPSLDSFNPAQIGDGCPGTRDESFTLPTTVRTLVWGANVAPAQIAVDPTEPDLWVTDYFGSEIDRVDTRTLQITPYPLTVSNASAPFGAEPWQVVADASYVYATEYGNSELVRINKNTGQVDDVRIPLLSDTEQAHSLAVAGGKLYFTLSDDSRPTFGAMSTFGYIDIAAWEAASSPCLTSPGDCAPTPADAVIYTKLFDVGAANRETSDFRGIAASANGSLAIADWHQVLRLSP